MQDYNKIRIQGLLKVILLIDNDLQTSSYPYIPQFYKAIIVEIESISNMATLKSMLTVVPDTKLVLSSKCVHDLSHRRYREHISTTRCVYFHCDTCLIYLILKYKRTEQHFFL